MLDFIRESLSLHNLPASLLLGMVVIYWLLVILGFLDNDFDVDADVQHGGHGHAGAGFGNSGWWSRRGRWLNFGEVPLSIIGSFVAIFLWVLSMLSNYYFNGSPGHRSLTMAVVLLAPNAVASVLLARVAVLPFQRIFQAMQRESTEAETVTGRMGRVVSAQVDGRYGQVEVVTKGAPLLVNARVEAGAEALPKGSAVVIGQGNDEGSFYFVRPATGLDLENHQQNTHLSSS